MENWYKDHLFYFALWTLEKGDEYVMNEMTLKLFASTYVALILAGRRDISDVPANLLAYVQADLDIVDSSSPS
ncbi:CD1375 family protein [Paenibacillus sp. Z6-24]